jgi:creatinine amidohydrolase/Fe(II)-dependent formamide hydrolase-like protein
VNHDPATRRLDLLTSTDIGAIGKTDALVLQPIGAVEQHGPHLPCATDALLADAICDRALAVTPAALNVWRLPIVSYGKSTEHLGYPGTISLSTETLLAVCNDIGRSVAASGFRKLAFVNGHGGQPQLLEVVARDIRERTGLQVFPLFPYRLAGEARAVSSPEEAAYGIHGGEGETSLMLAVAPDLVRRERFAPGSTRVREAYAGTRYLSLEGALPTAWLTRDLAPDGVIGDPTPADGERGERALAAIAAGLAGVFAEICRFEFGGDHG